MSTWFIPFVLLYSSTLLFVTNGQCLSSCEPCTNGMNCARCPVSSWGDCYNTVVYFHISEWICGDDCRLCCNEGKWFSLRQCMRAANGTKLASAENCWKANQFLPRPYDDPDPTTYMGYSSLSDNGYQSYRFNTDSEEVEEEEDDDDEGGGWGLIVIWAALVVFLIALKQYRRRVRAQRTSQEVVEEEEEEEEPLTTQTPADSGPAHVQNTNQTEVVVVVAPDGEVDVGLKDQQ